MSQLAAVLAELEAILALYESPLDMGFQVARRVNEWRDAVPGVCSGSPAANAAADAALLSRCLSKACSLAVRVEAQLQGAAQLATVAHLALSSSVCAVMEGCLRLATAYDAGPLAPRLCQAAAPLALGSGLQLSGQLGGSLLGQASTPDIPQEHTAMWAVINLGSQTGVLACQLHMVRTLSTLGPQHAPAPSQFSAWVLVATQLLKRLGTQIGDSGCLRQLAMLLVVAQQPEHSQFRECLRQPQLCGMWAGLLLPALASAAVGLGLPAERRLPLHDWAAMDVCADVLTSPMLKPTLQRLTQAAGRDSSSPEAATLARLLTSPAAMVQLRQAEAGRAPFGAVLALLGTAAFCQSQATEQAADRRLQMQHAEQLRVVLPHLARMLQHAVVDNSTGGGGGNGGIGGNANGDTSSNDMHVCSATACNVLHLLQGVAQPPGAITTLRDIEEWAAAASTALRMLPAAAEAARQRPAQPAAGQQDIRFVTTQLANSILDFALSAVRGCMEAVNVLATQQAATSLAAGAPAIAALWQLHSTVCRLVCARGSLCQQLPCIGQLDRLAALAAASTFAAAMLARLACIAAAHGGGRMPRHVRDMEALAVAHMEAMQALFSAGLPDALRSTPEPAPHIARSLADAVECGPAALAARAEVQELFSSGLAVVPQDPPFLWALLGTLVDNAAAARSPHLGALLLSQNALDAFSMKGLMRSIAGNIEVKLDTLPPLLEALVRAADEAIGAAEDAGSGSGGSNDEEQLAALNQHQSAVRHALRAAPTIRELSQNRRQLATAVTAGTQLAEALLHWWRRPAARQAAALELAQAAARRSCAYLRCANLGSEGGPGVADGVGIKRCSGCCAVWYCGTACSHADWKAGHRSVCKALGELQAARVARKERRRQQAEMEQGEQQR